MYHRDLKITGVNQGHANNLWRLATFKEKEKARPAICLAILKDGVPLVVTNGYRRFHLPDKYGRISAENIEEVAKHVHAKIVIAVEKEAVCRIVEHVQGGFRYGEDNFKLMEEFFISIKDMLQARRLILYPDFFNFIFNLDAQKMRRFFDVAFPPNSSMLFYLFHGQSVRAGLTLVRGDDYIEHVIGHDALKNAAVGFYPWQKRYSKLLEAVKEAYAPPSLGFFAEIDEVKHILWYPQPGGFLRSFIAGKIIIDPMPGWVTAALGVDAVTSVARTSMDLIKQFDTLGITRRFDLGLLGRTLQERLQKEELTLEKILGFDPISFLGKLINWLAD